MPTVLITGIRGFIAQGLSRLLAARSYTILGSDRNDSARMPEYLDEHRPDIIIHAAAELYDESQMFASKHFG